MSMHQRDPMFESLDRLAAMADLEPTGDRMPDIQRRVRTTRRRKGAAVAAAAVVLAVGAAGAWQALPSGNSSPPVNHLRTTRPPSTLPPVTPSQRVMVDAQPQGASHVLIKFTVTGKSSTYTNQRTDKPIDYAGPQSIAVLVDGAVVSSTRRGAISCEPGGALTPYALAFHQDKALVVPVASVGEHRIVVKVPYCVDGRLVASTGSAVVTTKASGFTTFDKIKADLDGDGTVEDIRVLVPRNLNAQHQLLRVTWGTGETTTANLANTMETSLLTPVDLDGDGNLELILQGGGGDVSIGLVFLAAPTGLEPAKTVDAQGKALSLVTSSDPAAWQTDLAADGIFSYRLKNPAPTQFPAPVDVRTWTLAGSTLTQSASSTSECVTFQPAFILAPC